MANRKQEYVIWWIYESSSGMEEGYFPIKATSRTNAENIFLKNNTPHLHEFKDGKFIKNRYGYSVECVYTKDEYDEMMAEDRKARGLDD